MKIFSLFLEEDDLYNNITSKDQEFLIRQIPLLINYGYNEIEILNYSGITEIYDINEFLEFIKSL